MIKAIIIDDEQYCIDSLQYKLEAHANTLELAGSTTDASKAAELVARLQPDLLFLDINLGSITGFQLLEKLPQPLPKIIFTTAYDQYAIKAFRFNAIDYLLKPVEAEELAHAIGKLAGSPLLWPGLQQIQQAVNHLQIQSSGLQKLALPTLQGFELVDLDVIERLEAASNYTQFMLQDGSKIMVSKTLKDYEDLLEPEGFCRIHQSHIINLRFLKNFKRGKTATAIMQSGAELDISATRREVFMERFRTYFKVL